MHRPFRGLLGVHSRCGLHTRAATKSWLALPEGFSHLVSSMTAPVASGWSTRRVGLAPTGKRRLSTAHANCCRLHPGEEWRNSGHASQLAANATNGRVHSSVAVDCRGTRGPGAVRLDCHQGLGSDSAVGGPGIHCADCLVCMATAMGFSCFREFARARRLPEHAQSALGRCHGRAP